MLCIVYIVLPAANKEGSLGSKSFFSTKEQELLQELSDKSLQEVHSIYTDGFGQEFVWLQNCMGKCLIARTTN